MRSVTRPLRTTGLALALMMASAAGVHAETVIGADGAPGAFCDPFLGPSGPDPLCDGGNGESVTAAENPAVAYGGNGGNGGIGGVGGSATAVATASAASGDVTASALAVGGNGGAGIYYHGLGDGGDASAMSTATSGDVSVYSTAWAGGGPAGGAFLGGFFSGGEGGYAYAFSAAFPYGDVANAQGDIVFGIATVEFSETGVFSPTVSFEIGGYRGELFVDGFDVGPTPSDGLIALYGPGTFVLSGVVPEPSTWAMMLMGFGGLGFAGYRASRRTAA